MFRSLVRLLSSLRLAVASLVVAAVLVFAGTIAQVHQGLWEAQRNYFQSFFVCWRPHGNGWAIPIWPGGYLLGSVLLANLLCAHLVRFKFTRRKAGILLIHLGLVFFIIGQLLTELFQVEGSMRLEPGQSVSYSESPRQTELAVIDVTDPIRNKEYVISDRALLKGREVQLPLLPITVRLRQWYENSNPRLVAPFVQLETSRVMRGVGQVLSFTPCPPTRRMDQENIPSAQLEIITSGGERSSWMVSCFLANPRLKAAVIDWAKTKFGMDLGSVINPAQQFTSNGRTYELVLRPTRYYNFTPGATRPYTLTLLEFRHDLYRGTTIPKSFASEVRLQNPERKEDRTALIEMNYPLHYGGQTFYQASFDPADERVTILQVVRNPVWLTPYIACLVIAAGLMTQFGLSLWAFLKAPRPRRGA